MDIHSVQTGDAPKITLNGSGNLSVKGWDKAEVYAKSSSAEDPILEAQGDEIDVAFRSNGSLHVPYGSTIQVDHIKGDASFKALEGELTLKKVSGNLSLRSVGQVSADAINGNLSAKNLDGGLNVRICRGNVSIHDIQGDFLMEETLNGNLSLKEIDGSGKADARGNISVQLDPSPESSYDFKARGNLTCRLAADSSVSVNIQTGAKIAIKIPGVEVPARIEPPYELVLGDGDANLILSASGNVSLTSRPPDWEMTDLEFELGEDFEGFADSINQQISAQIEAQMEMMDEELQLQLDNISASLEASAINAEQAERIAERARMASERANKRAQEKIRRAQQKMERKLEAARRRAERKARAAERAARDRRRRQEPTEWVAPPPKPPSEPVSEEERLMILQLLEQGKVTSEEAEQLLAALEGKRS